MNLNIDIELLRKQYQWLISLEKCEERDGLIAMLEHLLNLGIGQGAVNNKPGKF